MQLILFDLPEDHIRLYPLTFTRPISELRTGILTIRAKWSKYFPDYEVGVHTVNYLSPKFLNPEVNYPALWVNASILPDAILNKALQNLSEGESLFVNGELVGFVGSGLQEVDGLQKSNLDHDSRKISRTWDLTARNQEEINNDFALLTAGRESQAINDGHTIVYGDQIFLEEGAEVNAAIINTEKGPVYLAKDTKVQEGSVIHGPFALGEQSVLSLGTKVRGPVSIGPGCKVGGEVSKSIFIGHSNKAHDGFLGNSVVGEWCNLAAATNNSNLKNNYKAVKMWDYESAQFIDTAQQFCGLVMGDHSKSAIGTLFNTGTTVGVFANIFGAGLQNTHIPSFSWGGGQNTEQYDFNKAIQTADLVMQRRNLSLTDGDKAILRHIFEHFCH